VSDMNIGEVRAILRSLLVKDEAKNTKAEAMTRIIASFETSGVLCRFFCKRFLMSTFLFMKALQNVDRLCALRKPGEGMGSLT
jgi:hypothetical protein